MPSESAATDWPVRQKSANGQPKPSSEFVRSCRRCKASFIGLAPGKTGERGLWDAWAWYCSQECYDKRSA